MTDYYTFTDNIALSEVDDELVLLDLKSGQYYGLNATGAVIADLIKKGHSLDDISTQLADRFSIEIDQARQDSLELIDQLITAKLVRQNV